MQPRSGEPHRAAPGFELRVRTGLIAHGSPITAHDA